MESVTQGGRSVQAGPISHGSPAALLPPQRRGRESGACSRAVLGGTEGGNVEVLAHNAQLADGHWGGALLVCLKVLTIGHET